MLLKRFIKCVSAIPIGIISLTCSSNLVFSEDIIQQTNNNKNYGISLNDNFRDDAIIMKLNDEMSNKFRNESSAVRNKLGKKFPFFDFANAQNLSLYTNKGKISLCVPLKSPRKENVISYIKNISQDNNFSFVGPDYIGEELFLPNDELIDNQWSIVGDSNIGLQSAWELTKGNSQVRVGVIDSGITQHEDLVDNLVEGRDFWNLNNITHDVSSDHGTHVAGIICAKGNNQIGVSGVAPNVTLVPLQCRSPIGYYFSSTVVSAINYATSLWGTDKQISVLNYSVSQYGTNTTILDAIHDYPGVFVWAAGNEESDVDDLTNISDFVNCSNLISVGSFNQSFNRPTGTAYGNGVSVFAPGVNILSTVAINNYASWEGTSMAAPHVSGTAALLYSKFPNITANQIKTSIISGGITQNMTTPHGNINAKYLSVSGALSYATNIVEAGFAYLRFGLMGKSQNIWTVRIINDNNCQVNVVYNSKMCFESDASTLNNLINLHDILIQANGYVDVLIQENVFATSIVAAIGSTVSGVGKRYITYADNLTVNLDGSCSTNSVSNVFQTQNLNYIESSSVPPYLSLFVVGRTGFLSYTWTIRISNNYSSTVHITYNSKMCFESDAKVLNVQDLVTSSISGNSYIDVNIVSNALADYIVACIDYSFSGFDMRRITYANQLSKNGNSYSIGTNKHNYLRELSGGFVEYEA